jgi:hypothetical protein
MDPSHGLANIALSIREGRQTDHVLHQSGPCLTFVDSMTLFDNRSRFVGKQMADLLASPGRLQLSEYLQYVGVSEAWYSHT